MYMTIRDVLNPLNMMILLCTAAVVMIGFKGIQMLASVRAADRMQEHFSRFKDYFEAQLEDGKLEDSGDASIKANLLANLIVTVEAVE
ncbi:hypothetical protein BBG47_25080 [Paenibacillus sp. KS1]|nr:hypothetical protein BBG47_25080 [Paenibacillus sp. KS1]